MSVNIYEVRPGYWADFDGKEYVPREKALEAVDVAAARAEKAQRERATADKLRLEALQEVERLRVFARKLESIMDSICGMQGFNFSEHAYPLRAALDAAGFPGKGYEEARAGLGTLIENVKALEIDNERLKARVAELEDVVAPLAAVLCDDARGSTPGSAGSCGACLSCRAHAAMRHAP